MNAAEGKQLGKLLILNLSEGKQHAHMPGQFAGLIAPSYPSVAQLGVQNRGKSSGSTKAMALVKPLPNPPQLSQHHLPLQCACSSSPAMCHCELISSYHTRVQGRWPLLMPGVLAQAITPPAGHSLWPVARRTTGRSGFSENGLREPGTSSNLLYSTVVLGHNRKVFKCPGFYYMAGPLPVAFRCVTGLILFSLHITQLLTWQISGTLLIAVSAIQPVLAPV